MRHDTMSMLREFTGEELLWLAVRSNAGMRAKVARVIESRARRGAVAPRRVRPVAADVPAMARVALLN
ncbi:MAG: hypothetical protein JNM86_06170 [Phycisphaerae bacterium]|nr:hypothetical protein [Phycisphaerae bacterium]MBN8597106.1 hypothetical protein [Planctomycetota bacterium]